MNTQLLAADARRTVRDPMLIVLALVPPVMVAAYAGALPQIDARIADPGRMHMVHTAALATLVLLTPLIFGLVAGLMLLDERDEGVLAAIAVSPLGTTRFIGYRLILPAVWSAAVAALAVVVLPPSLPVGVMLMLPVLAALEAPLMTLFLGATARNKVEGMALSKVGNVVVMLGALAPLLPAPWHWAGSLLPHFWVVWLMISVLSGAPMLAGGIASLAVHVAALLLLARRQRSEG